MHQQQIDVIEPEPRDACLGSAPEIRGAQFGVPHAGSPDERPRARQTARRDACPTACSFS